MAIFLLLLLPQNAMPLVTSDAVASCMITFSLILQLLLVSRKVIGKIILVININNKNHSLKEKCIDI